MSHTFLTRFSLAITLVWIGLCVSGTVLEQEETLPIVPGNYVTSIDWSSDGTRLAYGTGKVLPPWGNYAYGGFVARIIETNGEVVFTRDFGWGLQNVGLNAEDDQLLMDPFVQVWDLKMRKPILDEPFEGLAVNEAVWSPKENVLLLSGVMNVYVYDPLTHEVSSSFRSRKQLVSPLPEDARMVKSIWSPDGLHAISSTTFGSIYVWDASTQGENSLKSTFIDHTTAVQSMDWNAATNLIVSGDDAGAIFVWNPESGEPVMQLTGHTDAILDIDWHPSGDQIVSTSADRTVRVWDWPSGTAHIFKAGEVISALAYSPDGTQLAFGGEVSALDNVEIQIVAVDSLVKSLETAKGHPSPVAEEAVR